MERNYEALEEKFEALCKHHDYGYDRIVGGKLACCVQPISFTIVLRKIWKQAYDQAQLWWSKDLVYERNEYGRKFDDLELRIEEVLRTVAIYEENKYF
jgi:hypothetical protein